MIEYKRHLITAALPYANGPLHIGHLSGAYLSADIYVRFLRLMDKNVVFICGSDEHGAAITMRAIKENKTPQEIIDTYHELFIKTFKGIGISFDYYHRTSAPLHHETAQAFFKTLYEKKEFVEQETEQYYDEKAKQFLADRYIMGTCPKCGHPDAYGDQCEKCGSTLNPTDLINPRSVLTGEQPVKRTTKHWFLPLDKYEKSLSEFIEAGTIDGAYHHDPETWKNHVLGQCKSWINAGLQPRAMTRDLDWGVDVPKDIPGSEGKKLYVWMDAPIGYISATKQWSLETGNDWKKYWQNEETQLIHFIGKDNIVFHCLIFPAILKAHGDYNLPANVPANQFMNLEGQKISTSRNWAVWVHEYLEELPGHEDSLRYYLTKNMPEQKDSEFTWKTFQDAHNNELVNNLSNFIHRVIVLTEKYYDSLVPEYNPDQLISGVEDNQLGAFHETELLYLFDQVFEYTESIRRYDFRSALKYVMEISSAGNLLLQKNEPWKNHKIDPELVEVVLNLCLQYIAVLSVIVHPILPFTSLKIRNLLNLAPIKEEGELLEMLEKMSEDESPLPVGHRIGKAAYVFTKIDDSLIERQIIKLNNSLKINETNTNPAMNYVSQKDEISYDDFSKMDIRTAKIVSAEKVAKADKLLKLQIDLGYEQRTVVSGIAEHFQAENIIGQEILVLANLAPRTIRGIESRGMILMAENAEGKLGFVSPNKEWPTGCTVK